MQREFGDVVGNLSPRSPFVDVVAVGCRYDRLI